MKRMTECPVSQGSFTASRCIFHSSLTPNDEWIIKMIINCSSNQISIPLYDLMKHDPSLPSVTQNNSSHQAANIRPARTNNMLRKSLMPAAIHMVHKLWEIFAPRACTFSCTDMHYWSNVLEILVKTSMRVGIMILIICLLSSKNH